jgi:putative tryptophan/tyrosine transport system substrate-binding protein
MGQISVGVNKSTYRRGQPMIGFSMSMVSAGTLAATYSSVDDTVAHLGEVVDAIESARTPEPQYPKYWRVAINENVARSLNVVISDAVRSMGNRPRGGS